MKTKEKAQNFCYKKLFVFALFCYSFSMSSGFFKEKRLRRLVYSKGKPLLWDKSQLQTSSAVIALHTLRKNYIRSNRSLKKAGRPSYMLHCIKWPHSVSRKWSGIKVEKGNKEFIRKLKERQVLPYFVKTNRRDATRDPRTGRCCISCMDLR
jgi:hypothetical protein